MADIEDLLRNRLQSNYNVLHIEVPHGNLLPFPDSQMGGTCAYHASTKALEANLRVCFGVQNIPPLSVQHCMDTCEDDGNRREIRILNHLRKNGVASSADVPYRGIPEGRRYGPLNTHHASSYFLHTLWNPTWMMDQVLGGPVLTKLRIFENFPHDNDGSGIYRYCPGTRWEGNHQVVVVGWCVLETRLDPGVPIFCWIYLNSWGRRWGFQGYGLIEMSRQLFVEAYPIYTRGAANRRKYGD